MSERSERLLAYLSDIRSAFVEEAAEAGSGKAKKRPHWGRWAALAACLAVIVAGGLYLLPQMGGGAGGEGTNSPEEGPSTFMSYAGPVFPLTLREENAAITAERDITLDFAPWVKTWRSNEDEANSRTWLTEAGRQKVLDNYNEWYPEGGRWQSSTDLLVTDEYTLTNTSDADQTLTVLYPFACSLYSLNEFRPTLTADGAELDAALHAGAYAGGYEGAWNGAIGGDENEGSVNLNTPDSWEDYRDALADGTYLRNALGDYPDLSGTEVIVYEFTDPWGEEEDDDAGRPNPTIRADFSLDYDKTTVLATGFHGMSRDRDKGRMSQQFSIPQTYEPDYGDNHYRLIVVGEDIRDLTTQGYVTGGFDTQETIEAGVTVNRYEADLEDVLRQVALEIYGEYDSAESGGDFEMYFGLFKLWLVSDGPLSSGGAERYGTGWLWDNDVRTQVRLFYLEAAVTVPAGGSVKLAAQMRKEGSFDFTCAHTENRGVYGYDMVTELGSNLNCSAQTATLADRGQIEIVRQNFGFDLAAGIRTVTLDPAEEHYYLEVRRLPEGE